MESIKDLGDPRSYLYMVTSCIETNANFGVPEFTVV